MKRIRSELIELENLKPWNIAEALLPEYSEQQYQDLEEFLENGGQLAPITIAENGTIVDGYNRWRTAKRLSLDRIECDVYTYDDLSEMEIHAIVLNSKRRHLNRLQIARAAARLTALLPPAEPVTKKRIPDGGENSENNPESESADVSRPGKPARTVSQKLGVLPSTVQQVSKVDNSGNEQLISAMEKKLISIKHASEIAEMNDAQRREAINAIEDEKKAKVNSAEIFCRSCNDCLKKLQGSRNKLKGVEFSESEYSKMKSWIAQVTKEADALMKILSGELSDD